MKLNDTNCPRRRFFLIVLALLLTLCACGEAAPVSVMETPAVSATPAVTPTSRPAPTIPAPIETSVPSPSPVPSESPAPSYRIVIDPGHQQNADTEQEPIGPGASETKYKVTGGTHGVVSGLAEYELTLDVSLLLREELERRGYEVILTRERHDVNLSNRERSEIANAVQADAFLRIHANGSENPETAGAMAIIMTPNSPYNARLYPASRALAEATLDGLLTATGARSEGIWETDTMSGINWSEVPVTILEVGYMTNPEEDRLMASADYQNKIVQGVANGLDAYFTAATEENSKLSGLKTEIQTRLDMLDSRWDVWVEDLASGESIHCIRNLSAEHPGMVSASVIKLFIMGAVYQAVEDGTLGESSVAPSLHSMITISDNASANTLTRLLGNGDADAGRAVVNRWAESIGCTDIQHNRLMLENNGLENYVTAEDCARLLRLMYTGECVSGEASEKMLDLLKAQQVNDRIPAGLPEGTVAAHKTGNLSGLCVADVGIVYAPAGDYILCAICNDSHSESEATAEIAAISELTYQTFA